ncbi:MAG TPA: branched-chain amino acid ABC transporter permease [Gammaproteobacteria bacterium]|jgi:branched-chain amino acid transport system permease protein|nr:branched-chain amino acid ABC transporter permease [Gammaproteobacteria bacterium]HIF81016.1 branched-chain amino acid ABC transporter permease [Gammaproteobacteria bacterium]HIM04659.1 branched-chain amino acid ABC transporter permease [Gammaproteobacteria bacterium]|tara:strand:- start:7705 stop:8643 length:939 start_codon:yes stop_codon:yes gene_type:complete
MIDILSFVIFFFIICSFYIISSLGLNIQYGFTGMFNVGIAGFFAVGAYTSAILTGPEYADTIFGGFQLPIIFGWLCAIVVSGLAGVLVGLVTLRLREDFLAISTFGIAICIQLVALNSESVTRGPNGLYAIPKPFSRYLDSAFMSNLIFLIICIVTIVAIYYALERVVKSPWGRVLRSIREDEVAAEALGKNVFMYRLQAFVLGCGIMGLAGAMYANFVRFISPQDFLPIFTIQVYVMLIVGGKGNNLGAIVGAIVIWALWSASDSLINFIVTPDYQTQAAALRIIIVGMVLVLMLLFKPLGILPEKKHLSS